jgi:hypothetical protein
MARLQRGRSGSNDPTGAGDVRPLLVTALSLYEERDGVWGKPTPKAPFGSIRGARCVRVECNQPGMTVTPREDGSVKIFCNACRADGPTMFAAARRAGHDLRAPVGGSKPAPFSVRRDVRRIKPLPQPEMSTLLSLGKSERKELVWLATLAKGRSWLTVTQRGICAGCGVSGRDAVPILRRLAEVHKLIEVQKNGYAAKRATKLRFLVNSEAVAMSFGGLGQNGVTKHQNGVTMERGDSYVLVRNESLSLKKRHWDDAPSGSLEPTGSVTTDCDAPPLSLAETLATVVRPTLRPVRGAKRPMTSAGASEDEALSSDPTPVVDTLVFHGDDHPPPPPPDPPLATGVGLEECGYACREGCIAPYRHKRNAITGALGEVSRR